MMLDIEKIKAAAMAATQGEWIRYEMEDADQHIYAEVLPAEYDADGEPFVHTIAIMQAYERSNTTANATFIALANPQAVLELINRLEAAEKDAARLDYLQQNGSTIDLVGKHLHFRVGGICATANSSIREAIDAAMKESEK